MVVVLVWLARTQMFNFPCLCLQYGKDYEYEAPVKLLDKMLHSLPQSPDEQLVVVSQVFSLSLSESVQCVATSKFF